MKWTETITPKQAAEELGVPYHGWMREMDRAWISEDQKYSVMSRLLRTEWGKVEHVTITAAEGVGRSDGSGDIPWAVKMEIKNDLFGEKRVAVEVFPTQDRLVDVCDCYHLWVFEKGFQLPFGIHPRDKKTVTVNRGSTRVRAIDGAGREHSIKELLEENGAADVPKQAYGEESYDGEIYHGKTKFITWDGIGVPDDIDSAMQMVIGEFVCDDIRRIGPEYCVVKEDIESAISGSCLTVPQVKDYAGWKSGMSYADLKDLYGWHISDLKIYDRPRPLSDFTRLRATKFGYEPVEIRRPPQSWFYVEDAECTS